MSVSIFILTLNEESNIEACLKSVSFSDDIVVLDSFSSDRTVERAKSLGASVVQRKFDNWSAHQNWAMQNITFKHKWVFYLDADERMTPELQSEIQAIAANPSESRVGFFCSRTNYFMGKPIVRCYPPVPIMRFFQPPFIRYERLVNPVAVVNGETGNLKHRFVHFNFSKGLTEWVDKHNKYSLAEAIEADKVLQQKQTDIKDLFHKDRAIRRIAIKNLANYFPMRWTFKFFYLYFARLGFLDGGPGLTYCVLITFYEYLIDQKLKEIQLKRKGITL